jgi:pilus assembly protein CpaD
MQSMKLHRAPIIIPLFLALAACATDYTKSEAPNALRVDGAETRVDLSFAPGSGRLSPIEAARLDRLVTSGIIRPSDQVTVASGGPPALAAQRVAAISRELLTYGIVAEPQPLDIPSANHAILGIGRYTVTLPPCPNWSESPNAEYTNAPSSNWGCAAAVNLGLMVADPADLVSGRPLAPADARPAVDAVQRYFSDRVKPPPTPTASPFAPIPSAGGGEAGGPGAPPPGVGPSVGEQ